MQEFPGCRRRGRGKRRPVGLIAEHRRQRIGHVLAVKSAAAGEHFVEHAPERPDVAAPIDRLAPCLLRAHVRRRAENHPGLGHRRRGDGRRHRRVRQRTDGRFHRLGQAEVEHLHRAIWPDLDVGGFQIPVDDALLVRRLERLGDLPGDGERFIDGNRDPRAIRSASVGPSTSSMTSALIPSVCSKP